MHVSDEARETFQRHPLLPFASSLSLHSTPYRDTSCLSSPLYLSAKSLTSPLDSLLLLLLVSSVSSLFCSGTVCFLSLALIVMICPVSPVSVCLYYIRCNRLAWCMPTVLLFIYIGEPFPGILSMSCYHTYRCFDFATCSAEHWCRSLGLSADIIIYDVIIFLRTVH